MYPNLFYLPEWVPVLGGEPVTSFGVMMFLAFLAAGWVARAEMDRKALDPEKAWDLLLYAVIGGIVGAKVYYVLLNFPRLMDDPAGLLLSRGGLVFYGGLLGGTALVVWGIHRMELPFARMADVAALAIPIAYAIGRVGCFLVGDDYGRPTGSWVGIAFPEGSPPTRVEILEEYFGVPVDPELVARFGQVVPVHPTQLYEVALTGLIFLVLWRLRRHAHRPGWLFGLWMVLAGAERFLVEFLRAKDDRLLGPFTVAQVISVLLVAGGFVVLARLRTRTPREESAPARAS